MKKKIIGITKNTTVIGESNMEKWYFIAIAVIFGLGMIGMAYTEHGKTECRVAAIQAKLPVDQIDKVCK